MVMEEYCNPGEDRETTIIDGNENGSVVSFNSGEDSTSVLSGFTIKMEIQDLEEVYIFTHIPNN